MKIGLNVRQIVPSIHRYMQDSCYAHVIHRVLCKSTTRSYDLIRINIPDIGRGASHAQRLTTQCKLIYSIRAHCMVSIWPSGIHKTSPGNYTVTTTTTTGHTPILSAYVNQPSPPPPLLRFPVGIRNSCFSPVCDWCLLFVCLSSYRLLPSLAPVSSPAYHPVEIRGQSIVASSFSNRRPSISFCFRLFHYPYVCYSAYVYWIPSTLLKHFIISKPSVCFSSDLQLI